MPYIKIQIISLCYFITFALFMFLIFRNYILQQQNVSVDANIVNTKQYIKKSIDFLINEKKQSYLNSSKIIFSNNVVTQALENKNRDDFYKIIKTYYKRLQKRDKDFWGLHIILADNMSFIRVHKPNVKDKLIIRGTKPLIDKVNLTQQYITSFDAGKFGYFLRVVTPIFSPRNKYLGVAEFSINVDSLTQYIKNQFGYEALFLVSNKQKKSFLNNLAKTSSGLSIFKSTHKTLFKNYNFINQSDSRNDGNYMELGYKNYSTVLIKLSETANLAVAFDVTNIISEQKLFKENLSNLIYFIIFIFSIIWFFATKFYIKNKLQADYEIEKSHQIISKNVIFSNTDLQGKITEVSDAFCQISGYTRKELYGYPHSIVKHPDTKNEVFKDLWRTIQDNKIWKYEVKNLNKNGQSYWIDTTISPRYDKNNKKIGYMSIKQDITDKKRIEKISITDSLTGIYNRRHFDYNFEKIINSSKRNNDLVCFLIMDIDFFKQYNDSYGHQMGDEVLKAIASSLQKSLQRADDYCFRLGGEEFGLILKINEKQNAFDFAEKIRANIENLKIEHSGNSVSQYVTTSIGIICSNAKDISNADEIYKQTDDLLYKAKDSGRNKVISNR